jgi:hypothetical protein
MAVVAIVLVLVASGIYFGWYVPVYRPLHETVVSVNNTSLSMSYLIDTARYLDTQGYISAGYASYYAEYALSYIQSAEVMRQEAEKMGITVSEEEIDQMLEGYDDINNAALRGIVRNELLINKLKSDYFDPQVPATADQRHVMAMFLESQAQANEVKARIQAGEDFGTIAAELSLDATTKNASGDMGFHPSDVISTVFGNDLLEGPIFSAELGDLEEVQDDSTTKQVGYWLVKVTDRKEDNSEAYVLGMLLGSEEEALDIKARLDAGEDFNALAEAYSRAWDEEDGADFGWIPSDSTDVPATYIFNTDIPLNTVSDPIQDTTVTTEGGYWLFELVGASNMELSADDRDTMVTNLLSDWLDEIQGSSDNVVESYFDSSRETWAVDYLESA